MMTLVVGHRAPFVRCEWAITIAGVIAESREATGVITIGPCQRVVCVQREVTAHALAEAEVDSIIAAAIDGFVIADARQDRLALSSECAGKRTRKIVVSVIHVAALRGAGRCARG